MDLSKLETDSDLESNGVWVTDVFGKNDPAQLLIARWGNSAFNASIRKRMRRPGSRRLPDDVNEDAVIQIMAQTILLDWKEIKYNSKKLAFNYDNAYKMLQIRDFRELVFEISNEMETFRAAEVEEGVKNSKAS